MEALPTDLPAALHQSRVRLQNIGRDIALRHTGITGGSGGRGGDMALAGREAIFADAVLGAIKARLSELKLVTK